MLKRVKSYLKSKKVQKYARKHGRNATFKDQLKFASKSMRAALRSPKPNTTKNK